MILVSDPIIIVTSVDDLEQRMRSERRVAKDRKRRVPLGDRENAAPNAPTTPPKNGGSVPTFTFSTPQRYVRLSRQSLTFTTHNAHRKVPRPAPLPQPPSPSVTEESTQSPTRSTFLHANDGSILTRDGRQGSH